MSQISSSSGVRVAAQPLSNVYTVLLLVGALALTLTLVVLCITMNARYGVILGVGSEGKLAKEASETAKRQQAGEKAKLEKVQEDLKRFPEGVGAAPAIGTTPAEKAPAEETPAEETPAEKAPAEKAPAEKAPAEKAPAEEAPAEKAPAEKAPAEEAPAEK